MAGRPSLVSAARPPRDRSSAGRQLLVALAGLALLGVCGLVARNGRVGALERAVKQVVERQRPGTSIGSAIHARGDVSLQGLSFVSGHSVIVTAVAGLLTPTLPRRWKPVPWVIVVLNGVTRVYVGAHNPLDVAGGFGLGLVIAGVPNALICLIPRMERAESAPSAAETPVAPDTAADADAGAETDKGRDAQAASEPHRPSTRRRWCRPPSLWRWSLPSSCSSGPRRRISPRSGRR